jgi:hypothetical protein
MIKYLKNKKLLFYCCLAVFVAVLFVAGWAIAGKSREKKKQQYIGNPQTGDVYLVKENKKEETGYYFLKVAELWEDSIIVYHSSFEYNQAVKELDKDDYFVLDEQLIFTKNQLQQMLDNNEISMVERNYGSNESFNRMKY